MAQRKLSFMTKMVVLLLFLGIVCTGFIFGTNHAYAAYLGNILGVDTKSMMADIPIACTVGSLILIAVWLDRGRKSRLG